MKRILALLVAVIMFAGVFAACSKDKDPSETVTDTSETKNSDSTGDGSYHANVPDKKFDGDKFIIMCRSADSDWAERAVFGESDDPNVLGASTWMRNQKVMGLLEIELEFEQINTKTVGGTFYNLINENALVQDYICDICIQGVADACNLIGTGNIRNLDDVPYIDLTNPWWAQKSNDSIAFLNKHYFAINDMLLSDKLDTYALFFNKDNFDDNGLSYPYAKVENGTWTVDVLKQLITDFGWDLNRDGVKNLGDAFGMAYQRVDSFFTGFGLLGASLNEEGIPEMNQFSDRIQTAFEKMYALRNNYTWNEWGYWDDGHTDDVVQTYLQLYPNVLFVCGPMAHYLDIIPMVENNVGVVPSPKLDDTQKEYVGRAGLSGTTVVTVLGSTPDTERAGIVIEVLGAEAKNYTSPAFYDTLLTDRYAQDEESKRMISIIINSEVLDLDALFTWGNMNRQLELNIANKKDVAASTYAKLISEAEVKLDDTIASILERSEG